MLVLSRSVGEEVLLRLPDGRTVRVIVLALQPNRSGKTCVRLGIGAPDEVRIYRADAGASQDDAAWAKAAAVVNEQGELFSLEQPS